jgi:hypothetical protein
MEECIRVSQQLEDLGYTNGNGFNSDYHTVYNPKPGASPYSNGTGVFIVNMKTLDDPDVAVICFKYLL